MFKITGLDKLTKTLQDAQKALSSLDGEIGTVNFDPNDPATIQAAIQRVEDLIDERVAPYSSNSIVGPLAEQAKEHFRQSIIEKAAAARLTPEKSK